MIETILRHALAAIVFYRRRLTRAMTGPFLLLMASAGLSWLMADQEAWPGVLRAGSYLLHTALFLAGSTLAAVAVHRVLLLGNRADPGLGLFWTRRESWFVLYLLGIVVVLLPAFLLVFIPLVGPLMVVPAMGYLMARCSLVYPGIAIDQGMSFRLSWAWTRGYQWPAFVLIALIPWLISYPFYFLPDTPIMIPIGVVLHLLLTVYIVAMLSLLYKMIVLDPNDDTAR
jgi:hypothetical protein